MSTDNRQVVDVRGLATTGLTASTTLATHLQGLEGAVRTLRHPGTDTRVSKALSLLNEVADIFRRLKM